MTDNYDIIKDFLVPTEILVEEMGPTRAKIILEPFEQGFGHTLGNALRKKVFFMNTQLLKEFKKMLLIFF